MADGNALNVGDVESVLRLKDEFGDVASKFMNTLSEVIPGLEGLAVGVGVFTAAVAAGIGVIAELGSHGSAVDDVTNGFTRLAGGADQAHAMLDQMRAGVVGTISDFELMREATKMMSAGVQLSTDQYGTLTQAARVLGHEGFGPTKDILNQLSEAMITGRTRAIEKMTGVIDLKAAEDEYGQTIDAQGGKLDKVAQTEAKRQAILEQLNHVVEQAGTQELTFAEKVERSKATLENLGNAISVAVATSPVINTAMDAIGSAIQSAFGGNQVALVETITGYVNKFAIFVVDLGIGMTTFATVGVAVWGVVKTAVLMVESALVAVVAKMAESINGIVQFAAKVPGVTQSVKDLAASSQAFSDGLQQTSKGMKVETLEAEAMVTGHSTLNKTIDTVGGTLYALRDKMVDASKAGADHNKILNEMARRHEEGAAAATAQQKAIQQLLETWLTGGKQLTIAIEAFKQLTQAQKDDVEVQAAVIPMIEHLVAAHRQVPAAMLEWYAAALRTRDALVDQQIHLLETDKGIQAHIAVLKKQGDSELEIATQIGVSAQALKEYVSFQGLADKAIPEIHRLYDQIMKEAETKQKKWADEMNKAWEANAKVQEKVEYDHLQLLDSMEGDSLAKRIDALNKDVENRKAALKKDASNYQTAMTDIEGYQRDATDYITRQWYDGGAKNKAELQSLADQAAAKYAYMQAHAAEYTAATVAHFKELAKAAQDAADGTDHAFEKAFTDIAQAIPNLLQQAFTGGGGMAGAATAIGSMVGQKVGKSVADSLTKEGAPLFQTALGDVLNSALPGVGSLIGPLAGALWNSLFGTAGRDAVTQFANSKGGFDALHQQLDALGKQGEQLWINLTQGVGRNNPQQAQAAIDAITKALGDQSSYLQRLPGEMQKYGLTWEQAGKQAEQAHLDDIAKGLIQDFADLTKAGFDVSLVTDKMSKSVNDYIHEAMRTGTEVPAAMKPLLQKMIEMGTLTDDAGNKLTDLSGLSFAETLTQGFNSVVDAIKQLTQALTGGGPGSLSGALETIGNTVVSPHIRPVIDYPNMPGGPGGGADNGGGQAEGGDYWVTQPTWFLAGEAGPEPVSFGGANNKRGLGGGSYTTIIQIDGREVARATAQHLPDELIRAGVGGGF